MELISKSEINSIEFTHLLRVEIVVREDDLFFLVVREDDLITTIFSRPEGLDQTKIPG